GRFIDTEDVGSNRQGGSELPTASLALRQSGPATQVVRIQLEAGSKGGVGGFPRVGPGHNVWIEMVDDLWAPPDHGVGRVQHDPAGTWAQVPSDQAKESGLAGAVGADQAVPPRAKRKGDTIEDA